MMLSIECSNSFNFFNLKVILILIGNMFELL